MSRKLLMVMALTVMIVTVPTLRVTLKLLLYLLCVNDKKQNLRTASVECGGGFPILS